MKKLLLKTTLALGASLLLTASPVFAAQGCFKTFSDCPLYLNSIGCKNLCSTGSYSADNKNCIFYEWENLENTYFDFSGNCTNCDNSQSNNDCTDCNPSANTTTENIQQKEPQKENTENSSKPDSSTAISENAAKVLSIVNSERSKNGLSPLTINSKAQAAAEVRAKEIASVFSHTRPDGRSCFTALDEAGITSGARGENIARGQSSPERVMNDWMNSEGHRANILNPSYSQIGIGVYKDSSGRLCWTQMFIG